MCDWLRGINDHFSVTLGRAYIVGTLLRCSGYVESLICVADCAIMGKSHQHMPLPEGEDSGVVEEARVWNVQGS